MKPYSSMILGLCSLSLATNICCNKAMAAETSVQKNSDDLSGIVLQGGVAQFSGGFSQLTGVPVSGLQFITYQNAAAAERGSWQQSVDEALGGTSSSIAVNLLAGKTKNQGTDFPFSPDSKVNFASIDLSSSLCALANFPVHVCLNVGIGDMQLDESTKNRQNYATIPVGAKIEYVHDSGFLVNASYSYRSVSQTVNNEKSSFAMASETLGLGWKF